MRSLARALLLAGMAMAMPPAAWGISTTVGGRRVDLDGTLEVRQAFRVDKDTAPDDTMEVLRLRLGLDLADWLDFETSVVGMHGGPTTRATKSGIYNYDDAFQDVNPSFEVDEAYFDFEGEEIEVRAGLQKFFWGKLDRSQPNDLLNPYRYIDPLLTEQAERKIGIPAVQLTYAPLGVDWLPRESRLNLVWAPMYVPFRLPVLGERWFPPAAETPPTFVIPGGVIRLPDGTVVPRLDVPIRQTTVNTDPPARRLENSSVAVRAAAYTAGVDYAFYYSHGYDVAPAVQLQVDSVAMPNPASPLGFDTAADTRLLPVYSHIDSFGADAAYTWESFTFRAEGAFVLGRAYSRNFSDLVTNPLQIAPQIVDAFEQFRMGATRVPIDLGPTFARRNTIEWGLGADYSWEGWFALLQINQTDVLDNDLDLLIRNVETRFLANLRKSFLQDRLRAQLIAVYGVSGYLALLPRLTYALTDYLDVQAGYLLINGSRNTIVGQYKRNDEGYLRLRVSF
jgi:hypothetical protein